MKCTRSKWKDNKAQCTSLCYQIRQWEYKNPFGWSFRGRRAVNSLQRQSPTTGSKKNDLAKFLNELINQLTASPRSPWIYRLIRLQRLEIEPRNERTNRAQWSCKKIDSKYPPKCCLPGQKYIFVEVQFESTNNAIYSRRISLRWILREVSRATVESRPLNLKHIITAIKFSLEARLTLGDFVKQPRLSTSSAVFFRAPKDGAVQLWNE